MTLRGTWLRGIAACVAVVVLVGTTARRSVAQANSEMRCGVVDASTADGGPGPAAREYVREIYALLDTWKEALREGDIETVTTLVTEDAEFWSQGAAPITGRAAVVEAFRPFFASYALLQEFECYDLVVRGDLAFMRGLERNRLVPRAGGDVVEVQQRAFSIMRRDADGHWRFARGMTNQPPGQ